jgi:thiaminase/transcriptional activator TenA
MSYMDDLEWKSSPIMEAILGHPFVAGIGDGTLDLEKFKFYVRQDYVYLVEFSRVIGMVVVKAQCLEDMEWFAMLLNETLNSEMDLHRSYCADLGVSAMELELTRPAPTTLAYTSYLLGVAYQGSYPEILAALLPCQWGYWKIGDHLARKGEPPGAPFYVRWIRMYADLKFKALADRIRSLTDIVADGLPPAALAKIEQAYMTSLRYEYMFWEMCYNRQTWPV